MQKRISKSLLLAFQKKKSLLLLLLPLLSSLILTSHCAKKLDSVARKQDLPYIKCQVCQTLAKELYQQVKKKEAEISPKKVSEFQIIEMSENVCNLKKQEADWILRFDIAKKGNALELVDQGTEGQCNSQCKTIERACQEVMGYSDTDVAEYIYKSKPQIDSLVNYLCKDLTKACFAKPPPLSKDWTPAEPFVAKSTKEAEMEKMMRSMEGMPGAPGMKMYSKEDLLNMNNLGDEDAEEDDEDDGTELPSKLGKVLREKETSKENWKAKITKGIQKTGTALKRHADKLLWRIQRWWRSLNAKKLAKGKKAEL